MKRSLCANMVRTHISNLYANFCQVLFVKDTQNPKQAEANIETANRRMGMSRRSWLSIVRRKFFGTSPHETIIVIHNNNPSATFSDEATTMEEVNNDISQFGNAVALSFLTQKREFLPEEDIAAIKIQAYFRGHLARRAFRALRSLVKLQAVARGMCVRRQSRIALHCMHALARLQVTVRARQLLRRSSDD